MTSRALRAAALALCAAISLSGCSRSGSCSAEDRAQRSALVRAGRGVVVTAVADLLDRPEAQSSLGDQALLGEVVRVMPETSESCTAPGDHWIKVETAAGYRAWIGLAALRPLAAGEPAYREGGALVRVTARFGSVYSGPTVTEHKPLLSAPLDSLLRSVRTVDARWLEVMLPSGQHGYVQSGDVAPEQSQSPSAACVIEHARRYEGTPYLWGGRSTLGIDCSGLVSNAYIACGVLPPRDAGPQFRWPRGRSIPQEVQQLQPADLLFFGERRAGAPPKVTHVGIYLGGGRFIHATTHEHPVVQESSIFESHWAEIWVGVRRFLPDLGR